MKSVEHGKSAGFQPRGVLNRGRSEVRRLLLASRFSFEGLRSAVRLESAFRLEVILGIVHYVLLFCLEMPVAAKVVLATLWMLMLVIELLNSAIEAVVDLVSPEWNELAKRAKDYGSAAVFCVILGIVIGWLSVLVPIMAACLK